jgi:hypothetical protein
LLQKIVVYFPQRGSWVSTNDPAAAFPSNAAFAAAETSFELTTADAIDIASDSASQTVRWGGSYLLDNGDGLERYSDEMHECCLAPCLANGSPKAEAAVAGTVTHHVAARGQTEFGVFISAGVVEAIPVLAAAGDGATTAGDGATTAEAPARLRYRLTLARRYLISAKDVRYGDALEARAAAQISLSGLPWEHIPLKAKTGGGGAAARRSSGKRKRISAEEDLISTSTTGATTYNNNTSSIPS